jgi:hypothetical protein
VGLQSLVPDAAWILSGINAGGNLGADVYHSGTVAAAREAVLHGWPAVALSHYRKRGPSLDWERAAKWAALVLRDLLRQPREPGTFWNINLPHLTSGTPDPDVEICRLDPSPLPLAFRQENEGWLMPGTTTNGGANRGQTRMCVSEARLPLRESSCSDPLNRKCLGPAPGRLPATAGSLAIPRTTALLLWVASPIRPSVQSPLNSIPLRRGRLGFRSLFSNLVGLRWAA